MSDYTLIVPDEMVEAARQIAEATSQPIEQVLLNGLKTALPVPPLPADEEEELTALRHLSDDALWLIAKEQFSDAIKARMDILMDNNSRGMSGSAERKELEALVARGERMMVRKAEAAFLLKQRGYPVASKDLVS
jgi:hypothetical protein